MACLTTGSRRTSPHLPAGVPTKAHPALFGAVCRQWTEAAEIVLPHAFQPHTVVIEYLLHVTTLLDGSEINPLTAHLCSPPRRLPEPETVSRSCPQPLSKPPACAPPPASLDCDCLVAVPVRALPPVPGYSPPPISRPHSRS